jgi:hypothetical protein
MCRSSKISLSAKRSDEAVGVCRLSCDRVPFGTVNRMQSATKMNARWDLNRRRADFLDTWLLYSLPFIFALTSRLPVSRRNDKEDCFSLGQLQSDSNNFRACRLKSPESSPAQLQQAREYQSIAPVGRDARFTQAVARFSRATGRGSNAGSI